MFEVVFLLGAGAIALWIDVRFPRLAPKSVIGRFAAAIAAGLVLAAAPVIASSREAMMASLFLAVFPAFVLALLASLWLLRLLRDATA